MHNHSVYNCTFHKDNEFFMPKQIQIGFRLWKFETKLECDFFDFIASVRTLPTKQTYVRDIHLKQKCLVKSIYTYLQLCKLFFSSIRSINKCVCYL